MEDPQLKISPLFRTVNFGGVNFWAGCLFLPMALFLPEVRKLMEVSVFEPLGKAYLKLPQGSSAKDRKKRTLVTMKWMDSCWEFSSYLVFCCLGLLASVTQEWFTNTRYFWLGCTQLPCDYEVTTPVNLLYNLEFGWYMQSAYSMLTKFGPRKKDHNQMLIHHATTMALIAYSYATNMTRIGCMTFLLHDVCDVFLQLAKLAKYAKQENAATGGFLVFLCVWTGTRLYYFPLHIIRSAYFETIEMVAVPYGVHPQPHHSILNGFLGLLFVCHIIWTIMILRVAFKTVTTKSTDDVREDSDDSDREDS
ncbi:hypothetical protein BSKO_13754 [Bryopsis sp. KO-2023]|nr:hypothetical protein BSKO_13754 [Bryopsis sp. KO-2023]